VVGYILTSNSDDAFVRKYSADGPTLLWSDQFGSSVTSDDYAYAVSVDASGVYVAGSVAGDGFVRKYGPNGPLMWSKTLDYGSDHWDTAYGISAGTSCIYAVGSTRGPTGTDGFVRKYDASGNEQWNHTISTTEVDSAQAASADASGVYVAGYTEGVLGQTS